MADYSSSFAINNVTVARNGKLIAGIADDVLLDIKDFTIMFVYMGATRGWVYGI